MLEQGKSVRSPAPEEEGAAETMCDELTPTPIPRPLRRWGGRERELGVELSQEGGRGGGRCSKVWFYFSLSLF